MFVLLGSLVSRLWSHTRKDFPVDFRVGLRSSTEKERWGNQALSFRPKREGPRGKKSDF